MPFLRFPLGRGKALIRHYASSSEKSPVCLRCSVVNALATLRLHYQLFSAKRSSLRSERRRSSHQTPLLRFSPYGEKTAMRRCCSSSAQRHNVGASPFNPPQFSKRKITAWFYGLPLLFRKKARQRSHVKNYRFTRFFTAYLTTAFFR